MPESSVDWLVNVTMPLDSSSPGLTSSMVSSTSRPPNTADCIIQPLGNPDALEGEGGRQDCTVFFSDIAGFTSLAELLTPAAVLRLINSYFTEMSEPIRSSQGIIDKYMGDAIMAFWAPPFTEPADHARLACLCALAQRERFRVRASVAHAELETPAPDDAH